MILVFRLDGDDWPVDLVTTPTEYLAEVYARAQGEMASLAVAVDRSLDRAWAYRAMWAIDHLGGKAELLRRELERRGAVPEIRPWEPAAPAEAQELARQAAEADAARRLYRALVAVLEGALDEGEMQVLWTAVRDRMQAESTRVLPAPGDLCQGEGHADPD